MAQALALRLHKAVGLRTQPHLLHDLNVNS